MHSNFRKAVVSVVSIALWVGGTALADERPAPHPGGPPAPVSIIAESPSTPKVEAGPRLTARQQAWLTATRQESIRLSEQLGEEGAAAFARKQGYESLLGRADRSIPQGFDFVYRTGDGGVAVIEAKGGSGPLGHAYGSKQGTPEWAIGAAKRTLGSAKATAAERRAAEAVLEAAKNGKLMVMVVRTGHVLGEPTVAILESTATAGAAEVKAAAAALAQLGRSGTSPAPKVLPPAPGPKAAIATAKTLGTTSKLARVVKPVAGIGLTVDVGIRVYDADQVEEKYRSGEITEQQRAIEHAKNGGGLAGGLAGAWAGAKGGALAGGAVGACFGGVGAPVGAFVLGTGGAVGGYFGGEFVGAKVAQEVTSAVQTGGENMKKISRPVVDQTRDIGGWLIEGIVAAAQTTGDEFKKAGGWVGDRARDLETKVAEKLVPAAQTVAEGAKNARGWVGDRARDAERKVAEKVGPVVETVAESAKNAGGWVADQANELGSSAKGAWNRFWN